MNSLDCLTARCLGVIYRLLGLVPLPPSWRSWQLLPSLVIRCTWLAYATYTLTIGYRWLFRDDVDISYWVGTGLFIANSLMALLLQLESVFKQRAFERLQDLRFQLHLQLQRLGMFGGCRRTARQLCALIGLQLGCDIAKTWANEHADITPVHLRAMPLMWMLRFRFVQLLAQVMEFNQRAEQLRVSLLGLAMGNDIWQPFGLHDQRQLQALRLSYECIFECYETFSDCYGWGLLGLHVISSFEFVSNAYWMITEAYRSGSIYMFIYNGMTTFATGTLISALFWYGEAGAENSRHIGCLISKLVKPLGSKRYNDLVCEFLLQTLHQRFVVTAKDFFSLNLHLLSSMFAAVVTYLVILIQFMFAERGYKNRTNSTAAIRVELNKLS
ncbi:gustatory receptor 23a [Drosophila busckii]|uniref:gustatory receptor 23a n=1 Tax=Drosophila busckii TaxID=30019 RepID=UPI00083EF5ED|nr:gustatory receptor 23a [Drosophila busckii]